MRKLIHKKWLSVPVTLFLVLVLSAGAVFASTFVGPENQIFTQTINDAPVPDPVYGSIEAIPGRINLTDVEVGESINQAFPGAVIVEVGPDGAGLWLHVEIDPDSATLYDTYNVLLISDPRTTPATALSVMYSGGGPWERLEASIWLEIGTYTFNATVTGTAGTTAGTSDVFITYTLEDTSDF